MVMDAARGARPNAGCALRVVPVAIRADPGRSEARRAAAERLAAARRG